MKKDNKTTTGEKNQPVYKAFAVENFKKDGEERSKWTEIGAAWPHKDGKGLDINIKLLTLSGRIVLREPNKET